MKKTCFTCANWDSRPEDGMDRFSGYCEIKDKITSKDYTCEFWAEPQTVPVEEMYENGDPFGEEDFMDELEN